MKFSQEEQLIKKTLEQVETPNIENLYEQVNQRRSKSKSFKYNRSFKLVIIPSLCCCLLFMMAFDNRYVQKFIELIGYEVYSALQPIRLIDEHDGIRLEVIGAMNDDETAVAYLTLQDLTGEIFDETLDIYNYTATGVRALTMPLIAYDETTKTATFRLQGNGGKNLNEREIIVGIQSFLTQKEKYEEHDVLTEWTSLETHNAETILFKEGVSSGGDGLYYFEETKKVLKPRELDLEIPGLNFVRLSNIGFIDNKLHIQLEWREDNIDDHGFVYLVNSLEEKVDNYFKNISFGVDQENNLVYGRNLEEYVFDISPDELSQFKLQGDFVYNGQYTEGDWRVKFKLDSTTEEIKQAVDLTFDETLINEINISALGVTLRGTETEESLQVKILLDNGEILESDSSIQVTDGTVDNSEFVIKILFPGLLDLSKIKMIQINDKYITLNKEE